MTSINSNNWGQPHQMEDAWVIYGFNHLLKFKTFQLSIVSIHVWLYPSIIHPPSLEICLSSHLKHSTVGRNPMGLYYFECSIICILFSLQCCDDWLQDSEKHYFVCLSQNQCALWWYFWMFWMCLVLFGNFH